MQRQQDETAFNTGVCIAGGGPAGLMLALLLVRQGIRVTVLEKHDDFLRDFRGDTIHPSTLALLDQLGLLERLLALPHQRLERAVGAFSGTRTVVADFRHLPVPAPFVALLPQWDFLDLLHREACSFPGYRLLRGAEVVGLHGAPRRVTGVRARSADGELDINADLVVCAAGRNSPLVDSLQLPSTDIGAPMNVCWFRLDKPSPAPAVALGNFRAGAILVLIDRGHYWQVGYVVDKARTSALLGSDIRVLRDAVAAAEPALTDCIGQLRAWDQVGVLDVQVRRLEQWHRDGVLCIGDAAHAMSPIAGVGINLAIQDATAAANLLVPALQRGRPAPDELGLVRRRRALPTRITQGFQHALQRTLIGAALRGDHSVRAPAFLRMAQHIPALQRLPARLIGMGARPERVLAHT